MNPAILTVSLLILAGAVPEARGAGPVKGHRRGPVARKAVKQRNGQGARRSTRKRARVALSSVTRATPKHVCLTPGGRPRTIRLEGAGLNLVTAVYLLQNERVVTHVTARVKDKSASSCEVLVLAGEKAAPRDYRLRLDTAAGSFIVPDELLSVRVVTKARAKKVARGKPISASRRTASASRDRRQGASVSSGRRKAVRRQDRSQTSSAAREVQKPAIDAAHSSQIGRQRDRERADVTAGRLQKMPDHQGDRGKLDSMPGTKDRHFGDQKDPPNHADLSLDLGTRSNVGIGLGSLGRSAPSASQDDPFANPATPDLSSRSRADSNLMDGTGESGTWSGTTSMIDKSGQNGNSSHQTIDRVEYYHGPDGSMEVITTHHENGETYQSVILTKDGKVTEENGVIGDDSGGSGSGGDDSGGSGSGGDDSGDEKPVGNGSKGDDSTMPCPDDAGGGRGRTWSQLTDEERREIKEAADRYLARFGAHRPDPSSLQEPDWSEVMAIQAGPAIRPKDGATGKAPPLLLGTKRNPVTGTQPAPVDPPGMLGQGDAVRGIGRANPRGVPQGTPGADHRH